ncbi:MAG: transcription termination/antitermination protein NusG [Pirellulaceae bacterium]
MIVDPVNEQEASDETGELESTTHENAVDENSGADAAENSGAEATEDQASVKEDATEVAATGSTATDDGPKMDWYILKVAFNREDSIADALRKRVKMEGMEDFFGEIVVPTEDVATFTRDGKRRISKRKLLPGYIMANMIINDDTWFLVRETGGISDFTGAAGKPMPMEPSDIERFVNKPELDEDEEEAPIKTAIPFKVGDRVRVKEGNFENQEGDVEVVDEASGRITVIINIFGRSVPMELDHWQVEPL